MKDFTSYSLSLNEEGIFKVDIEGLPTMYFNRKSAAEVKNELRKLLKNPGEVIKGISRTTPTEVKKDFRLRLTGKADLEGDDDDMNEGFSPMHVKQAVGIASDKRYKGGNMTGAVSAIEKLQKGLSKHPQVAAVLKRVNEGKDPNEYDNEGEMAKTQLRGIIKNASHMIEMFEDEENLPEWVQNKITKAADYLDSAHDYLMNNDDDEDEEEEEDDDDDMKESAKGPIAKMIVRERLQAMAEGKVDSDDAFDQLKKAGALNVRTVSDGIVYNVKGKGERKLTHKDHIGGKRFVQGAALSKALQSIKDA